MCILSPGSARQNLKGATLGRVFFTSLALPFVVDRQKLTFNILVNTFTNLFEPPLHCISASPTYPRSFLLNPTSKCQSAQRWSRAKLYFWGSTWVNEHMKWENEKYFLWADISAPSIPSGSSRPRNGNCRLPISLSFVRNLFKCHACEMSRWHFCAGLAHVYVSRDGLHVSFIASNNNWIL
jgi:hypothetical protein